MSMRVGMIGTGWITEKHLDAFARIAEGRPVAVAGRNEARAKALAERFGLAAYADPLEMVERERPDAVWISLPPGAHGELEEKLAGRVAGVLVEKPVALNLATARTVRDAFAKANTVAAAGYMNRYRPAVARAREWFAADADKPTLAVGRWIGGIPGPAWWRREAQSGGQYVEQLTHVIDLARWLVGEVESVTAAEARGFVDGLEGYDIADATVSTLRFASGAVGTMTTGCFAKADDALVNGIGLTVASRSRSVDFSGWNMTARMSLVGPADAEALPTDEVEAEGGIFVVQNRAFLRAVAAGDPTAPRSTYADGVETLRVTLAVRRAAANGEVVRIADV